MTDIIQLALEHPGCERLQDFYSVGPVQRAALESFATAFADRIRHPLQAKIDALMFEYCPDEMTDEQVEEWGKHQRSVSAEHEAAVDAALGITRKPKP